MYNIRRELYSSTLKCSKLISLKLSFENIYPSDFLLSIVINLENSNAPNNPNGSQL